MAASRHCTQHVALLLLSLLAVAAGRAEAECRLRADVSEASLAWTGESKASLVPTAFPVLPVDPSVNGRLALSGPFYITLAGAKACPKTAAAWAAAAPGALTVSSSPSPYRWRPAMLEPRELQLQVVGTPLNISDLAINLTATAPAGASPDGAAVPLDVAAAVVGGHVFSDTPVTGGPQLQPMAATRGAPGSTATAAFAVADGGKRLQLTLGGLDLSFESRTRGETPAGKPWSGALRYSLRGPLVLTAPLGCAADCGDNGRCRRGAAPGDGARCECECGWGGAACDVPIGACPLFAGEAGLRAGGNGTGGSGGSGDCAGGAGGAVAATGGSCPARFGYDVMAKTCQRCGDGWGNVGCKLCSTDKACQAKLGKGNAVCSTGLAYNERSREKQYACTLSDPGIARMIGPVLPLTCRTGNTNGGGGNGTAGKRMASAMAVDEGALLDGVSSCSIALRLVGMPAGTSAVCTATGCRFAADAPSFRCDGVACDCPDGCPPMYLKTFRDVSGAVTLDCDATGTQCTIVIGSLNMRIAASCEASECLDPSGPKVVGAGAVEQAGPPLGPPLLAALPLLALVLGGAVCGAALLRYGPYLRSSGGGKGSAAAAGARGAGSVGGAVPTAEVGAAGALFAPAALAGGAASAGGARRGGQAAAGAANNNSSLTSGGGGGGGSAYAPAPARSVYFTPPNSAGGAGAPPGLTPLVPRSGGGGKAGGAAAGGADGGVQIQELSFHDITADVRVQHGLRKRAAAVLGRLRGGGGGGDAAAAAAAGAAGANKAGGGGTTRRLYDLEAAAAPHSTDQQKQQQQQQQGVKGGAEGGKAGSSSRSSSNADDVVASGSSSAASFQHAPARAAAAAAAADGDDAAAAARGLGLGLARLPGGTSSGTSSDDAAAAAEAALGGYEALDARGARWRPVLRGVSGRVGCGEVLGVMGPSGGGKSTLLMKLCGGLAGGAWRSGGAVALDGVAVPPSLLSSVTALVPQDDSLMRSLTVEECIRYSAALRLDPSLSAADVGRRVEQVMATLGLARVRRSTVLSGTGASGVSGGERRRVAIAMELVIDPQILVLDEPLSGLDAFTALQLMRTLQAVAASGRVVALSLHQPTPALFNALDTAMLLAAGLMVYCGPPAAAGAALEGLGCPVPRGITPAEHLLHAVSDPGSLAVVVRAALEQQRAALEAAAAAGEAPPLALLPAASVGGAGVGSGSAGGAGPAGAFSRFFGGRGRGRTTSSSDREPSDQGAPAAIAMAATAEGGLPPALTVTGLVVPPSASAAAAAAALAADGEAPAGLPPGAAGPPPSSKGGAGHLPAGFAPASSGPPPLVAWASWRGSLAGTPRLAGATPRTSAAGGGGATHAGAGRSRAARLALGLPRARRPFGRQLGVLFWRGFLDLTRNPLLTLSHALGGLALGLLVGLIFLAVKNDTSGAQNRVGAVFFALCLLAFTSVTSVDLIQAEAGAARREMQRKYYSPAAYAATKLVLDGLLLRALPALLFGVPFYFLMGLSAAPLQVAVFLLVLVAFSAAVGALALGLASALDSPGKTILAMNLVLLLGVLFGGFLANKASIPVWLRWVSWLSVFRYAWEALVINELSGIDLFLSAPGVSLSLPVRGSVFLQIIGVDPSLFAVDVAVLVGMYALACAFVVAVLLYRNRVVNS